MISRQDIQIKGKSGCSLKFRCLDIRVLINLHNVNANVLYLQMKNIYNLHYSYLLGFSPEQGYVR